MSLTREEVLGRIRSHLSEELGIDAGEIQERSRFKEDIEADSLDLVELVMELEDGYGPIKYPSSSKHTCAWKRETWGSLIMISHSSDRPIRNDCWSIS